MKHSVYVLPYSAQALEDFTWLKGDVETQGGQASVFAASSIDDFSDAAIVEQFRAARTEEYERLVTDLRALVGTRRGVRGSRSDRRALRALREQYEQVRARDFFVAPQGREAEAALVAAEQAARPVQAALPSGRTAGILSAAAYRNRIWLTRPRPGIDRFACAWLIRRFIDAKARFAFGERAADLEDAVAFDMYDDGFRHQDGRCTFEVMQAAFGIDDAAVSRMAELVHDVDLRDERYRAPEAQTFELLVDGLRASVGDDRQLLEQGIALFEALYQGTRSRIVQSRRERTRAAHRNATATTVSTARPGAGMAGRHLPGEPS